MAFMKSSDTQYTVSVLIACYNVDKFIDRGIESVINQTYQYLDIVLVDDGSTDRTYQKCREWSEKDSRIRVVRHKQNLGLGAARNTGIANAMGQYIYFMDVDDVMHSNLIEVCINEMNKNNPDMIVFGFNAILASNPCKIDEVRYKPQTIDCKAKLTETYVDSFLLARHGCGFAWNKFYSTRFINENKLSFGTLKIQQDEPFTMLALKGAKKISVIDDILYDYYIYSSGNNGSRYISDRFDIYLHNHRLFVNFLDNLGISDPRAVVFLNKRLYAGILKYLTYDLKHCDCNLSNKDKKTLFKKVVTNTNAKVAITQIYSTETGRNRYQASLLQKGHYNAFYTYCFIENLLRKIYKSIKTK